MTARLDPAATLFDELAADYEEHFSVPSRRAYDDLAWEATPKLSTPGTVVDVGCGVGRWARRFLSTGHQVVGIEPSPAMAAAARRGTTGDDDFRLVEAGVEETELKPAAADLVVAMGSLQYAGDPVAALTRMSGWVVPGGAIAVLVDGLVALCLELSRAGREDEARQRAAERRGVWEQHGRRVGLHLFDSRSLAGAAAEAGLVEVEVTGLLVGFSLRGRTELAAALDRDYEGQLARERAWSAEPAFTDLGKQLLLTARRPVPEGERG